MTNNGNLGQCVPTMVFGDIIKLFTGSKFIKEGSLSTLKQESFLPTKTSVWVLENGDNSSPQW